MSICRGITCLHVIHWLPARLVECIITLHLAFAVANQETCEQPHFVDWALWEHGCVAERNVCIDQVSTTPKQSSPSMHLSAFASTCKCAALG